MLIMLRQRIRQIFPEGKVKVGLHRCKVGAESSEVN